ncbi:MAG: DedA family protein [Pseudonocardiales bacterium]|nr:DedA family protein [Pseudonocardiales bacterium]
MAASSETTGIVGWVVDLMETLGAPGVGLAIALENLFPPLPSEVFLPLAGFAAARGELSVGAAIVWTTLGSLVGALALYGLGAGLGRERLRAIADRMPLVDVGDIDKAEEWFARHGPKAVFFGRMIPLVRSMISVPAGVERMPLPLFAALTTAGSLIWNSAFVLAGYGLGENWHVVEQYAGIASRVVLVAVVLALVWFVVRKVRARRAVSGSEPEPGAESPTVTIPAVPVPGGLDGPTVRLSPAHPRHPQGHHHPARPGIVTRLPGNL